MAIRPGVYNNEYFSSSQAAIYIGDVLVDEITAIQFMTQENRRPLYGYADRHYRALSKGQVIVQGQFSINFKEAGYLWLILNRYKGMLGNVEGLTNTRSNALSSSIGAIFGSSGRNNQPFLNTSEAVHQNVEKIINGEFGAQGRTQILQDLTEQYTSLAGYTDSVRASEEENKETGGWKLGAAESIFEAFENAIWKTSSEDSQQWHREPNDPALNPFDIYVMYGDYMGDDRVNHTIVKLEGAAIIGSSQVIDLEPFPIQEAYQFIARMRV